MEEIEIHVISKNTLIEAYRFSIKKGHHFGNEELRKHLQEFFNKVNDREPYQKINKLPK